MVLSREGYRPRLVDQELEKALRIYGAINIKGPKWCGKTWSAYNCCNSAVRLDDPSGDYQNRRLAQMNPSLILEDNPPQLIDEWQEVPSIWDAVRYRVDSVPKKGLFVLTGSATPNRTGIVHSGTGRIFDIRMDTLTLFERGLSDGKVSLKSLFNLPDMAMHTGEVDFYNLVDITVHGGWPATICLGVKDSLAVSKGYIDTLISSDINFDGVSRSSTKMNRLIRSLARNECTIVSKRTLCKDIMENDDDEPISYNTVNDYLNVLERLYFVEWQPAFNPNMRSSVRVGKMPKRHLIDPSLAVAALGVSPESYYKDLSSFGFIFESLCEHDLRIYADTFGGRLYHYRDGDGKEIDAIVELPDGRWGAFEIKLGANEIEKGAKSLLDIDRKIRNQENGRPPEFLCVVCGLTDYAYRRPDGVYVVPITSLRE